MSLQVAVTGRSASARMPHEAVTDVRDPASRPPSGAARPVSLEDTVMLTVPVADTHVTYTYELPDALATALDAIMKDPSVSLSHQAVQLDDSTRVALLAS